MLIRKYSVIIPIPKKNMQFSKKELQFEAKRLYSKLKELGWSLDDCQLYAPLTIEINQLKKEQNAIILAHSYQSPDIMYGVADFLGDSLGLSIIASNHPAAKIIFASVYFMAETAKILAPLKTILVPARAGCSLADSITVPELKKIKKDHPNAKVICYINTSAEIKAESDVCCTSANSRQIINKIDSDEIIFIPDEFMAQNLQKETAKKIISWPGRCIVHESFNEDQINEIRRNNPGVKILAHLECSPSVVSLADMAGSTGDILNFIKNNHAESFMIVTECGITDRIKTEFQGKKIVGACALCPYMKQIDLKGILKSLKNPSPDQQIEIHPTILKKAKKSLENMWKITNQPLELI